MIKTHRWKLVASSILILLPALVGLILWNELPEQMTTHWGADGVADDWGGRAFAVFGPSLFILAAHWICVFFTARDPKNRDQSRQVSGMVLWICPLVSLFANGIIYTAAFGKEFDIETITLLLIGVMFVFIGNYLPKCRQNYTIGIKIKWTLASEENWNATHRVAGRIWVVGGLLIMACVFLPGGAIPLVLTGSMIVLAVVPMLYSYLYYQKQVRAGTAPKKAVVPMGRVSKVVTAVSLIACGAILLFVGVLMFTGDIRLRYEDTSFTIDASYWSDLTVEYGAVDRIEYREEEDPGRRASGFGSPRLGMGLFENDEFGQYTRYAYTGCTACIVLDVEGKTLVISGPGEEETREIYEELLQRIS